MDHSASPNGYKNSYRQSQTHPRNEIRNELIHNESEIEVFLKKTANSYPEDTRQAKRPVLFSCVEV